MGSDGCWIWQGAKNDRGYPTGVGEVRFPNEGIAAGATGVVAYETWKGDSLGVTGNDHGIVATLDYDDVTGSVYRTEISFDIGSNAYRAQASGPIEHREARQGWGHFAQGCCAVESLNCSFGGPTTATYGEMRTATEPTAQIDGVVASGDGRRARLHAHAGRLVPRVGLAFAGGVSGKGHV